jgi:hypothetical protein
MTQGGQSWMLAFFGRYGRLRRSWHRGDGSFKIDDPLDPAWQQFLHEW